jgi:hypothetical protein
MKKLLLLINMLLLGFVGNSQVLFTDDFENYTLGNVFTTIFDNTIPGQGGWHLIRTGTNQIQNNAYQITQEANNTKVLTLTTIDIPTKKWSAMLVKPDLGGFIDQRTIGNNVIKIEVDYYTGEQHNIVQGAGFQPIQMFLLNFGNNPVGETINNLLRVDFVSDRSQFAFGFHRGDIRNVHLPLYSKGKKIESAPYNTWITYIAYLDYTNRKIYVEVPYLNAIGMSDQFLINSTSTNLFEDFKPTEICMKFSVHDEGRTIPLTNKYDNIKITALKSVPPHIILSAATFLNEKFNIYPNPATNLVTITNNDNMPVQEVTIYDMAGKKLSTQIFNNQTEIQLNVAQLASGTYLLHIQTTQGTAVKQLIKK